VARAKKKAANGTGANLLVPGARLPVHDDDRLVAVAVHLDLPRQLLAIREAEAQRNCRQGRSLEAVPHPGVKLAEQGRRAAFLGSADLQRVPETIRSP